MVMGLELRGSSLPPVAIWSLLHHWRPWQGQATGHLGDVHLLSLSCWQCLLTQLTPEAGLGVGKGGCFVIALLKCLIPPLSSIHNTHFKHISFSSTISFSSLIFSPAA